MARYSRLVAVGGYLPGAPVTNEELVARGVDTSDEWIRTRSGIITRHFAADDEQTSDLAVVAAQQALATAGWQPNDVELIVLATSTPDMIFPSTATIVQDKLGITNGSPAFDVQAVCTGFVYALTLADQFIRLGAAQRALVIGAEIFSRILDWRDRTTCVLFGDGAGAVLLEASDAPGILATKLHADGRYRHLLCVPGQTAHGQVTGDPFVRMQGQAVFKFAVQSLADVALEVLEAAQMTPDRLDWLVPHQANIRILEATAKRLEVPFSRVLTTVQQHGNTSAASIPLALCDAVQAGQILPGQTVLLEGIGGGFTWGAALLRW
ncbi:beta-ketoacyl-ACP synthase III [Hydrogenophilus thiooxidans]|uniref:beta-ketoacyl-ACP synthase III n=1 Tax=Hydrogenophilus thiooxidans TaxID=2820326 RepID=UPI001C245BE1|nr:beta-ketoacyl-ACP synthase III [Hydrogenophilus thiooxidans]